MRLISAIVLASLGVPFAGAQSTGILPANGATGVPLNAHVIVTLGLGSYLIQNAVKVTKNGAAVAGTLQTPSNASYVTSTPGSPGWFKFTPTAPLDPSTTYTVEVDFPSAPASVTRFTTGTSADTTPLALVSADPPAGQTGVSTSAKVTFRFNKPIDPFSVKQNFFAIRDLSTNYTNNFVPGSNFAPQLQADGSTIVFQPALVLGDAFQTEFIASPITDWLGNPLAPLPAPIPFTTQPQPETEGPILAGTAPADGDAGIAINSTIVLVFDKPLAQLAYDAGVKVDAGGPVKFKIDTTTIPGGRAMIIQPAALLPANTQINVSVTGVVDVHGAPLASPIVFGFRTGGAVDTRQLQLTGRPPASLPGNATIVLTFNRPIDPALLALGSVTVQPTELYNNGAAVPYQLSPDHTAITFAASLLPAGVYAGTVNIPFDRVVGRTQGVPFSFTITGDVDATPPAVLAVSPPDGMSDAPPGSVIQAAFSEPLNGTGTLQLIKGDSAVAGTVTWNSTTVSFAPKTPLDPGTTYQISLTGFTDLAGNALPDFSSSFSTGSAAPAGPFQVTSITPALNTTGVDPGTPIVITFNRTVNPVSLVQVATQFFLRRYAPDTAVVAGTWQFSGSSATYTPSAPLPPGSYQIAPGGITDLAGTAVTNRSSNFVVPAIAQPDSTSPAVVSVSPPDGGLVLYQDGYVVFTFSKPVDSRTAISGNFPIWTSNGIITNATVAVLSSTQVGVRFNASAGTVATLYVNPGLTDTSGNPAAPFHTTVQVAPLAPAAPVFVRATRPNVYSAAMPIDSSISILFSGPMDTASTELGFLFTVNGALTAGRIVWNPDSTALTFTPSSPLPYSAAIEFQVGYPAHDAARNSITWDSRAYGLASLKTVDPPPTPPTTLSVVRSAPAYSFGAAPLNPIVELEFSGDVPAAFVRPDVATIGKANPIGEALTGPRLACTAQLAGKRQIVLRPAEALEPNTFYILIFDSGTGVKYTVYLQTGATDPPAGSLAAWGPAGGSVPINTRIVVAFSAAVSELAMPGGIILQTGGQAVPVTYQWSANDRALIVTPTGFLLPDADYSVVMSGFLDITGHVIPDKTWALHTASTASPTTPAILRADPAGSAVSPNAGISVSFSEAVAGDWLTRFSVRDLGAFPAYSSLPEWEGTVLTGTARLSDDQQTLFFTPDHPWPQGHTIWYGVPVVDDFAGNTQTSNGPYDLTGYTFQVALAPSTAPSVIAASPDDGSSALPINVRLQVQFDQPVTGSSLGGVTLAANGNTIPASARVEADGRTVSIIPAGLPDAGSILALTVSGVTNTEGTPMAGTFSAAFGIGSGIDTKAPGLRLYPAEGQQNMPSTTVVRVRSDETLNKISVNARTVTLTRAPFNRSVDVALTLADAGQTIVATPSAPLAPLTQYLLTAAGVTDLAGNSPWTLTTSFLTGDGTADSTVSGKVVAIDPADGAVNLGPGISVQALFNQPVDLTLGNASFTVSGPGALVAGSVTVSDGLLTFKPARPLADGLYQVQISGIADATGAALPAVSSSFTVLAAKADTITPRLVSSSPAYGDVGVPVSSSVTLTYSKPVSAVAAAQIGMGWSGGLIPTTVTTNGAVVTITPSSSLPGAAQITVGSNTAGLPGVNLQFTTGANPDTEAPTLTYSSPVDGATINGSAVQFELRFSEPAGPNAGTQPFQVYAGANAVPITFTASEDGRTFSASASFGADTDITLAVSADLRDFAGNPIQPFSLHFRTESDVLARGPYVASVSPADGAVNVDVKTPIEVRFGQPMNPISVQNAFTALASGTVTGTTITADATNTIFDFQPAAPWLGGTAVEALLSSLAQDATGVQIDPKRWQFTTASAPAPTATAVAFTASASCVDVRFMGATPDSGSKAYLRRGRMLVPARIATVAADQIRIVPWERLDPGAEYQLVLDANQEIALQIQAEEAGVPELLSAENDPRGVRLRFSGPVNRLTVRSGLRLLNADGRPVDFTILAALDAQELILAPVRITGALTVEVEGMESRDGRAMAPRRVSAGK